MLNLPPTYTETDTSAFATKTINVTVNEQADAPNLTAPATLTMDEQGTVSLNIASSAAETDQNAPTIVISGVPADATLSAGTLNLDGTWSLSAAQLSGLTLTAGESTHSITLTVTATDTETDTSAFATKTINVTVNEQADAPNLTAPATLTMDEQGTVSLNISSSAAETDQNAPTIVISGVPSRCDTVGGDQQSRRHLESVGRPAQRASPSQPASPPTPSPSPSPRPTPRPTPRRRRRPRSTSPSTSRPTPRT